MDKARVRTQVDALAAPQPGTWLGVVPWVGLVLLAAAVGMSLCEMRTPILHLGMSFSAGQLLIGPAILGFLVHQVLGTLWGLVARRGDGPRGVRTALVECALASLHCAVAWLPVLLIPWFLGNVSAALTLRILLVGGVFGFTLRLLAAVALVRLRTRLPAAAHLPVDLLLALLVGAGLFSWAPASFGVLAALNPLAPVAPLLVPALSVVWAFDVGVHLAPSVIAIGSLPVFLLAHLTVQVGCVVLLAAVQRRGRGAMPPRESQAELGPTGAGLLLALLTLLTPWPAAASPPMRCAQPVFLAGKVDFEADTESGAAPVLALPLGNEAVLLHAESATAGRLVFRWTREWPDSGDTIGLVTSRRVRLPAHRAVVEPIELPEASQTFRAGMPPLAGWPGGAGEPPLLGVTLDLAPQPGPPGSVTVGQTAYTLLPVGLHELRTLLHHARPPAVLIRLSDLASLSEADAGLLLDALCGADVMAKRRVVVADDVPGPLPSLPPAARLLLPRRLANTKVETSGDYLRALNGSVTGLASWALPDDASPLLVRCSAEEDDGPLCPVPFRVTSLGQGTCAYVAFAPGTPLGSAPGDTAGLAEALLGRLERRETWYARPGASDVPYLARLLQQNPSYVPFPGMHWSPPSLHGGRWAPFALAGALLLAAGLAQILAARRARRGRAGRRGWAATGLTVPLVVGLCLVAGRWLGTLCEPQATELSLTWPLSALERHVTQRVLAITQPWAGRAAGRTWPAALPTLRYEVRQWPGSRPRAVDVGSDLTSAFVTFGSGLALAAGTVESTGFTDVGPFCGQVTGSLAIAADGSVQGTLSNGTGLDLVGAVLLLPERPVNRYYTDPQAVVVQGLRAGETLRLSPAAPLPRKLVPERLAGTPLAEWWPGLSTIRAASGLAVFVGCVAEPNATGSSSRGHRRQVQLVGARLELDASAVQEPSAAGVAVEARTSWPEGLFGPDSMDGRPRTEHTAYLCVMLPRRPEAGSPPRAASMGWRWADLPAAAALCLKVRNAWISCPLPTAEPANPASLPLGRLEIAVLDVMAGAWKVVAEDALHAIPEFSPPADAMMRGGAPTLHAVVEAEGRRRVLMGAWNYGRGQNDMFEGGGQETQLYQDVDACGLTVRLEQAQRYVHLPGGLIFIRATGTEGPLTAWLVNVGARVVPGAGDGFPPSAPPASEPW
jgi:hypothetical protein